jgi:hypothetical protein
MELEMEDHLKECEIGGTIPDAAKYTDSLGRERLRTPCTGTSHLTLRSTKSGKPDVHTNIAVDMDELLAKKLAAGELKAVFAAVVDGGNDYKNTREATVLLLGRLFKKYGLEGLLLFRRCGGKSYTCTYFHKEYNIFIAYGWLLCMRCACWACGCCTILIS